MCGPCICMSNPGAEGEEGQDEVVGAAGECEGDVGLALWNTRVVIEEQEEWVGRSGRSGMLLGFGGEGGNIDDVG